MFCRCGFLQFHCVLSCFVPSSTFTSLTTFSVFLPPCPFHLFASFCWNAAVEVKTKATATHTHTHTVHTHTHSLNQTDTNTCFGFCINALSCTSSSAAFIVVMLLHHSDCTWTQHTILMVCVCACVLIHSKTLVIVSTWTHSDHHCVHRVCVKSTQKCLFLIFTSSKMSDLEYSVLYLSKVCH